MLTRTRTRFADGVGIRGTPRHATTRSSDVTDANFHFVMRPSWRVLLKNRQTAYYYCYYCMSTRPADEKAFWKFHRLTVRDVGMGHRVNISSQCLTLRLQYFAVLVRPLSASVCRPELVFGGGGGLNVCI